MCSYSYSYSITIPSQAGNDDFLWMILLTDRHSRENGNPKTKEKDSYSPVNPPFENKTVTQISQEIPMFI